MDQGSNLSKEHAYIIPSPREILKPAQLIKHENLYTLPNCSVPAEYFDIHPKQYMYTQKIDWSQYAKESQLYSSEKEFILAGILNHDEDKLSLSTIQDIFTIKVVVLNLPQRQGNCSF